MEIKIIRIIRVKLISLRPFSWSLINLNVNDFESLAPKHTIKACQNAKPLFNLKGTEASQLSITIS